MEENNENETKRKESQPSNRVVCQTDRLFSTILPSLFIFFNPFPFFLLTFSSSFVRFPMRLFLVESSRTCIRTCICWDVVRSNFFSFSGISVRLKNVSHVERRYQKQKKKIKQSKKNETRRVAKKTIREFHHLVSRSTIFSLDNLINTI